MAHTLRNSRWLRWIEYSALSAGAVLLAWVALSIGRAELFERAARSDFEVTPTAPTASVSVPPARLAIGDVLGIVEIPRLGFSSIVVEGDSDEMLSVAVGHLPDTPLPWQPGNTAIAGHRDGHFRPLKDIKIQDEINLRTRHGTFRYTISHTKIVLPSDISVLKPRAGKTLTLVTCYPFSYIGRAPKRFVIHADAVQHGGSAASTRIERPFIEPDGAS